MISYTFVKNVNEFSKWQDTSKSGNLEKNNTTTTKQAASRVLLNQLTRYSFVVNVPILAHYARPKLAMLWSPKCHFLDHCLRKWIPWSCSWPWGLLTDPVCFSLVLKKTEAPTKQSDWWGIFNPFTAPACKIFGLKAARTHLQRVYCPVGPITHLLSVLWVWMKILSLAGAKNKIKRLKGFKFRPFTGRFQVTSWQWRGSSQWFKSDQFKNSQTDYNFYSPLFFVLLRLVLLVLWRRFIQALPFACFCTKAEETLLAARQKLLVQRTSGR